MKRPEATQAVELSRTSRDDSDGKTEKETQTVTVAEEEPAEAQQSTQAETKIRTCWGRTMWLRCLRSRENWLQTLTDSQMESGGAAAAGEKPRHEGRDCEKPKNPTAFFLCNAFSVSLYISNSETETHLSNGGATVLKATEKQDGVNTLNPKEPCKPICQVWKHRAH